MELDESLVIAHGTESESRKTGYGRREREERVNKNIK